MHEEQQPPEYQRAWPASHDGAGDQVTPPAGDADPALPGDAGQALPPDASSPHAAEHTQEMRPDTPAAAGSTPGSTAAT